MRLKPIALALALLAGATPAALAEQTLTGGFDVGPGGFQGNFNPLSATGGFTWLSLYFEPLVTWDAKLASVTGALARSYQVSADKRAYSFQLADAKWHDGRPFTAADVKFTIDLARKGESGTVFAARLAGIEAVDMPDPHTVVLRLSKPNAGLLNTLTQLMMLPEHVLAKLPADSLAKNAWWSTAPVGTGPFKFVKYETDQYVELAANPDYRAGRPKLDRVINRYFKTTAAAVAALKAGEIAISYVEADDVAGFKGNPGFRIVEAPSYVVNYLGFNQELPLWKDRRVRQAVMHAIDRAAIVKSLYGGAAAPAHCGYVEPRLVPAGIDAYGYDPAQAKALLKDAGWDKINGAKPITVLTYYTNPLSQNVLAAMQAMLGQVGISIVPKAVDTATYNATIYAKTPDPAAFPLVYAGLQDGPDPSALNIGLNDSQIPPAGANFLHIRMPAVTNALDAALNETDPAKSDARYQAVCQAMNADLPWATMWVANRYGVISTKLDHFTWLPAPAGGPYDAKPELWSLKD